MAVQVSYNSFNHKTQFVSIDPDQTIKDLAMIIAEKESMHWETFSISSQGRLINPYNYGKNVRNLQDFNQPWMTIRIYFSLSGWRKIYCIPQVYFVCADKVFTLQSLEKAKTIGKIKKMIFETKCHEGCNDHAHGIHGLKNKIHDLVDSDEPEIDLVLLGDQKVALTDEMTLTESGIKENSFVQVVILGADQVKVHSAMTATVASSNDDGALG